MSENKKPKTTHTPTETSPPMSPAQAVPEWCMKGGALHPASTTTSGCAVVATPSMENPAGGDTQVTKPLETNDEAYDQMLRAVDAATDRSLGTSTADIDAEIDAFIVRDAMRAEEMAALRALLAPSLLLDFATAPPDAVHGVNTGAGRVSVLSPSINASLTRPVTVAEAQRGHDDKPHTDRDGEFVRGSML